MNAIKKLFVAALALLLVTVSLSEATYAAELTDIDAVADTYNVADSETDETDAEAVTENIEDIEADTDSEDIFDPELYEIYIDEQGQVYYIEKEPKEPETDEVIQEEEAKEEKKEPTYSKLDLRLLACLVYTEAGNQPYEGMLAVANVVLNRVKSDAYYHVNTIEEVIFDKMWAVQFSVTIKNKKTGKSMMDKALESYDSGKFSGKNPKAEKKAMEKAIKAAKEALNGKNNIGDYLCFRLNNSGAKKIKKKYSDYRIIGDHIFYRTK
jgi:spore germination cell wall hydrolase CwlJ-like protein